MSAVDLTKCQPGDLLRLRDGRQAVYLTRYSDTSYPISIHVPDHPIECVSLNGYVYDDESPSTRDVIAIIHPTRAELEEQRRELLVAVKGALAALSQPMTYPADITAAKRWLSDAVNKSEATHG